MSSNHVDDRDAELESLLRATFAGEARRQVPDARSVPPFPQTERLATVHPLRRKWTGVVLVAAALVGIVVAGTLIGREAMDARPSPSTPAGTSVAPTPTVTTTGSATSSPTAATSTTSVPATKQVTVLGVTLSVPTSWSVGANPGGVADSGCLVAPGNTCALDVSVGASTKGGPVDPDLPWVTGEKWLCPEGPERLTQRTTTADEFLAHGVTVEHRVFTAACVDGSFEQWTIATAPLVVFVAQGSDPTVHARAAQVVHSALVGARSPLRLGDHGRVVAASATTLRLDRVDHLFQAGSASFAERDINPATYDYPLAGAQIECLDCAAAGPLVFGAEDLAAVLAGQTVGDIPPLDTDHAVIVTDGYRVISVTFVQKRS
ncbi:hypothetical protein ACXR2U_07565 [Jatrophihabitans sp. YIM 134969]